MLFDRFFRIQRDFLFLTRQMTLLCRMISEAEYILEKKRGHHASGSSRGHECLSAFERREICLFQWESHHLETIQTNEN